MPPSSPWLFLHGDSISAKKAGVLQSTHCPNSSFKTLKLFSTKQNFPAASSSCSSHPITTGKVARGVHHWLSKPDLGGYKVVMMQRHHFQLSLAIKVRPWSKVYSLQYSCARECTAGCFLFIALWQLGWLASSNAPTSLCFCCVETPIILSRKAKEGRFRCK